MVKLLAVAPALALVFLIPDAAAQDAPEKREPLRYRVALGAQLVPSYPGARTVTIRPLFDYSAARGDDPFPFEAPDESFGFPVFNLGDFEFGPSFGFESARKPGGAGAALDRSGTSIELGGFVQVPVAPQLRARVEVRKGLGGHGGWIANVGADFVARSGDRHLFSIGPRLTLSDGRYQRSYFGVSPGEAAATGLPAYSPGSGVQAAGVTAGYLTQLSPRWGIYSYAKYDRLIGDAAESPVVRSFGSRNQFSGGLGLSYTFGKGMRR